MQIYNSSVLHESFYKACGVRGLAGLKTIAAVGYSNTPGFADLFSEYAERVCLSTMAMNMNQQQPGRFGGQNSQSYYSSQHVGGSQTRPRALGGQSGWKPVMNSSKFCQFGRNAGLSDGKTVTQADLDLLYREVTRHSAADSRTGPNSNVTSGTLASQSFMGYGEFCTAVLVLATRVFPDLPFYDALRKVLMSMEDKLIK
ncbi:MAG: hypothetical protein EZS28_048260, partial [Streblomastix strix]